MEYMLMPYRRYVDFDGRSRRKEFWMFQLFQVLVYAAILALMFALGIDYDLEDPQPNSMMFVAIGIMALFWLVTLIPQIAVVVRRLHDQSKTGLWILIYLLPVAGGLVLLVFMLLEGTDGPNEYGPDPKAPAAPG